MPAPYSNDFRRKIVDAYEAKEGSMRELAARFKVRVRVSFVRDLWARYRDNGTVAPKPYTRGLKPRLEGEKLEQFRSLAKEHDDATLEELAALLEEHHGLKLGKSSIDRALAKLGVTRKKSRSKPRSATSSG